MEQIADFIGINNVGNAIVVIILTAIVFSCVFCYEVHSRENS